MTYHITNTNNPIDFPSTADKLEARLREEDRMIAAKLHAKGWRKRQIANLEAAADLHAGDGGYEEGTREAYEAFAAVRNKSLAEGRIRDLMIAAGYAAPEIAGRAQKLVQLVAAECAAVSLRVSHRDDDMGAIIANDIKRHFGVDK